MNSSDTPVSAVKQYQSPIEDNEIELRQLVDKLLQRKWLAISVAALVMLAGLFYLFIATPIYRADALIQVEKSRSAVPGLEEMQTIFSQLTHAQAEIEIIRSRSVVRRVVEAENLTISAGPNFFPVVGQAIARRGYGNSLGKVLSIFGNYAWDAESIDVQRFDVPPAYVQKNFTVKSLPENRFELQLEDGQTILEGEIGVAASTQLAEGELSLFVREIHAPPGVEFTLVKRHIERVISGIQNRLDIQEKGRQTGILAVSMEGTAPEKTTRILNGIINSHIRQNVERRSEEASRMLAFLDEQLPELKKRLEAAESELREYKQEKGTAVDISMAGGELLERATEIERRISELELERSELRLRFTEQHPILVTLQSKINQLKDSRNQIEQKLKKLPNTELESIRRIRNVNVSNELYVQLLNKAQELRVAKAGTIGDARILDQAYVPLEPVKPRINAILGLTFIIAIIAAVMAVIVRDALRRTLQSPELIEERLGLSIFATVPHSKFEGARKGNGRFTYRDKVLCRARQDDPAVESLRSLRTSLQFALFEARNNVVTIHGPTPEIGKSFVATNLAFLLADIGKKVLLVDGDMRKGHVHKTLGVKRSPGLSEILTEQQALGNAVHELEAGLVYFLSTGALPPNPSELLVHSNFSSLISAVSKKFDYIIIDTPPTLNLADSIAIGRLSGTNFLVVRSGLNTLQDVQLSTKRMNQSGININGVVFNDLSVTASKYRYGGYYSYKYKS